MFKEFNNGFGKDFKEELEQALDDLNVNTNTVNQTLNTEKNRLDGRITDIDKKVAPVSDQLAQLESGSQDNEVIIARGAYTSLTDRLNTMDTGFLVLDQEITATEGQTVFTINGTYLTGQNHIRVIVDGVPQQGEFDETSSTTITMNEPLMAGQEVYIEWFEGENEVPKRTGHRSGHEKGGYDELDVTKLKNYDEMIVAPLAENQKKLKSVVSLLDFEDLIPNKAALKENWDWTIPFNDAVVYARDNGLKLDVPTDTYKITGTIYWDSTVPINFNGSYIMSHITDNLIPAVVIRATLNQVYDGNKVLIENFHLRKASLDRTGLGIVWDSAYKGVSKVILKGFHISYFEVGEDFRNRAYNMTHEDGEIYYCQTDVRMLNGYTDYGERINFRNCVLYNSYQAVHIKHGGGVFHFVNCSIDYNRSHFKAEDGVILVTTSHMENAWNATTEYAIKTSGPGTVRITNSKMLVTTGEGNVLDYYVENNSTNKAGVFIENCDMININPTSSFFAKGTGFTKVSNISSANIDELFRGISENRSSLIDYSFEQTSIVDDIAITEDTAAITNPHTGTNIKLETSTSQFRTGVRSLKVSKSGGSGSVARIRIKGKVRSGEIPSWVLFWKAAGTISGSFEIRLKFENKATGYISSTINLQTITITSGNPWQIQRILTDRTKVPHWADTLVLELNFLNTVGDAFVGAGIYFDDINIDSF